MRQIVLDTETTGLEPAHGHRIIEIGCLELLGRRITGRTFHRYLNPERDIDAGALAVHGISRESLADQPRFAEIADALLEFLEGAEIVAHNAAFDVGFLDAELGRSGRSLRLAERCPVLDTLALAREMHPGQRNSLDALCKRYNVDNTRRELHGALLDARILAEVYLAMTGGQAALQLAARERQTGPVAEQPVRPAGPLKVLPASEAERRQHEQMLAVIGQASGGKCLWPSAAPVERGS